MDHLPLPQGAEPFITVPYKGIEHYDYGGFVTYPERKGWSEQDLKGENHFGGRSDEEVEAFFQTWLFFGFVIEVLKNAGIPVKTEDFLAPKPAEAAQNRWVVTTEKLPSLLVKWKRQWPLPESVSSDCTCKRWINPAENECTAEICWRNFTHARDSEAWHSTRKILDRVCTLLDRYCTEAGNRQSAGPRTPQAWPVRPEITTSFIALGYALRAAAIAIYDIPQMTNEWGTSSSSLLRGRLDEKWCKSDAALMMEDFQIDGHYYLAASASPSIEYLKAHSSCTDAKCTAEVGEGTYVTRHAPSCSQTACKTNTHYSSHLSDGSTNIEEEFPGDFQDTVRGIIDRGGTPIVLWDERSRKITAIEYNASNHKEPKYVAISHVWSDGMGNPDENWLPECQLSCIQKMVDGLNFPGREPGGQVGFWMDTLCVPVKKEFYAHRKLCIRNMRQIYKDAAAVLVLDSWLRGIPHTAPVSDRCARLYQSNWQRRLWTFQEGSLAQELYFQFSDQSQCLRDLADERVAFENDSATRGFYTTFPALAEIKVTAHFTLIKQAVNRIVRGEDPPRDRWMLFLPLSDALGHRQTTRISDEILCVSTILGMDPKPYLDIHQEKWGADNVADLRMELFLKEIGKFNAGLIFNNIPRLEGDGFRWAPRSLLGFRASNLGAIGDQRTARLRQIGRFFGLVVRYPGFKCKLGAVANYLSATAKKSFTISIQGSKRSNIYYDVELESDGLEWDSNVTYGLVMATELRKAGDAESLAMVGSVVPLNEGETLPEIDVLRFECNALVRRRSGEAPHGHAALPFLRKNTKWMIM